MMGPHHRPRSGQTECRTANVTTGSGFLGMGDGFVGRDDQEEIQDAGGHEDAVEWIRFESRRVPAWEAIASRARETNPSPPFTSQRNAQVSRR